MLNAFPMRCSHGQAENCATVWGNCRTEMAKMMGMTPADAIRIGRCVVCPPTIRRPTIRLAYWIGTLRTACVTKMTSTMLARIMVMSKSANSTEDSPTLASAIVCLSWLGSRATMPPKIRSETPFPIPYSVMIDPIQVSTMVPATKVVTTSPKTSGRASGSAPRLRIRMVWPMAWITARNTER